MTDKSPPCPRCGCTVSDAATYYFIPVENLRWHSDCYRKTHPEAFEDQPKDQTK